MQPGNSIVITLSASTWGTTPSVGDTLIIPANGEYGAGGDSAIDGATAANLGSYVVTAATSTTVTATKLRDNAGASVTAPENVAATDILAVTDFMCFSPVVVHNYTGTERVILTGLVGQTVSGAASGQTLTLTLATGQVWAALPQAGDLVSIPVGAPAAWRAANTNGGWYEVVSATSGVGAGASTIVMTRLSDGAPTTFAATAIAAVTDLRVLRPAKDGVGKSLELFDGGGAESVSSPGMFYDLSTTAVDWISTGATPVLLTSESEYVASLTAALNSASTSETISAGGDVVLRVGYHGTTGVTTATLTISGTTLTTTVSGGTGANLSIDLTKYKTLSDLATYINAQTGYVCTVGSTLFGQQATVYLDDDNDYQTVLDKATWGIASANHTSPGRIKKDGFAVFKKMVETSTLVQLGATDLVAPTAGQPEVQALTFLASGAKGHTTNARVTAALAALEQVRGNFLCTLFSRDATDDIADSLTDASSTYTIDDINAAAKSHVLTVSTPKRRRYRQAFLSKQGTFAEAKLAANEIASARCAMTFQDFKAVDSDGSIVQFQPWMGGVYAAAMQAAGFYKSIENKFINTSGVLMADGSYSDQLDSQVEDALQNGLLPAEKAVSGGFRWVSDQTTYGVDGNFVYNSIQAVYAADTVALTIAQRLEQAFVGQSLADVSAGVMLSFLQSIMADLKKLKLTASSDDAPLGYKDPSISIIGGVARVSLNVKLATALDFIVITTYITQVTSSASL